MEAGGTHFDVLIAGAGISGISMAAHLKMKCPDLSFAMIERRKDIGGTWDLFRYPGVRSDSDMHTLGFNFAPWTDDRSIAEGHVILEYLQRVVRDFGLGPHIRVGTRVVSADWAPDVAHWRIAIESDGVEQSLTANWLHLATGYYNYDDPYEAHLPGISEFGGKVVHPQFWPEGLHFSGKQVVIVGSGATAVTLLPAMAETAAHATMLQRTPTWMVAQPSRDPWARRIRGWLGERRGNDLIRFINIRLQKWFFDRSRREPEKVGEYLRGKLRQQLGEHYDAASFDPPYGPWQQRLCLVPDGDLLEAVKAGKASVVNGRIKGFDADGVLLQSGERLAADIVVTATGLSLCLGGKIEVSFGGVPVNWADHWFYRGAMFSNVPNLSVVFGYLNNSWTLRADNVSDYVCDVLTHMRESRTDTATPLLPRDHGLEQADIILFTAGYLERARSQMPKSAAKLPWRLNMDYLEDCRDFRQNPVSDGILRFERHLANVRELA